MRSAAVHALLPLYGDRANVALLAEFTKRFVARFMELLDDVDDSVAVLGVSVLCCAVLGYVSWSCGRQRGGTGGHRARTLRSDVGWAGRRRCALLGARPLLRGCLCVY